MSLDKVTLIQISTFITAVESGSFTEAAMRLYTSQSAVSHHISALETAIGQKLFARQPRKPVLTETGRRAYEAFKQVSMVLNDLHTSLTSPEANRETIRILASSVVSTYVLPALLTSHSRQYPSAKVVLSTSAHDRLLLDYHRQPVDLLFIESVGSEQPPETSGVTFQEFHKDDLLIVGRKSLGYLSQETMDLQALADLPLIGSNPTEWAFQWWARDFALVPINLALETSDFLAARAATFAGLGYFIAPAFMLQLGGIEKELHVARLLSHSDPLRWTLWMGWRDAYLSSAASAFLRLAVSASHITDCLAQSAIP